MNEQEVWNQGQKYNLKESEVKICGDNRVRLTFKKEEIEGYILKYELFCIDQNGKAYKQFFYEKESA